MSACLIMGAMGCDLETDQDAPEGLPVTASTNDIPRRGQKSEKFPPCGTCEVTAMRLFLLVIGRIVMESTACRTHLQNSESQRT
jgi:hypothetical protein